MSPFLLSKKNNKKTVILLSVGVVSSMTFSCVGVCIGYAV
jgi:hypothetical protein